MPELVRATLADGTQITFLDKEIGDGAEKKVFFSQDGTQAVCFFKDTAALRERRQRTQRVERLRRIVGDYNPTSSTAKNASYWVEHFCWPTGMIDDANRQIPEQFLKDNGLLSPALAVIGPRYRDNFFFKTIRNVKVEGDVSWFVKERPRAAVPDSHRGNLLTYLKIAAKLARAVRRMHQAGLAHSDLSNRNVLIDPSRGDACIIDIDALVVPHFAPPVVIGTSGYIAPEVVSKKVINGSRALPCIQTDRYALGVLIYEMLLLRHPLDRERPVDFRLPEEEDQSLAMGSHAIFREHPTIKDNHWKVPPVVPYTRLGPYLSELILRLFTEGLHDREKRPHAGEWERALYHTMALLHPTQDGALKANTVTDFFALATSNSLEMPVTRKKLPRPVPYARYFEEGQNGVHLAKMTRGKFVKQYHDSLTIWNERQIFHWHVNRGVENNEDCPSTKPLGTFQFWKDAWWLYNQGASDFTDEKGTNPTKPGQTIKITPGLKLKMAPGQDGRLFEFGLII